MTCSNCGADYDSTFDKCPYCGESFKIPGSKDKPKGPNYKRGTIKLARLINVKDEIADKIISILPYIGIVIAGLIIALFLYNYFTGIGSREYKNIKSNIYELDEMYEDLDYKGIYNKIKSMGEEAEKTDYAMYYALYETYAKAEKFLSEASKIDELRKAETKDRDSIVTNAENAILTMIETRNQVNKLYIVYSENKTVTDAVRKYMSALEGMFIEKYELTAEEVTEIEGIGEEDSEAISVYADVVYRRMKDIGDAYIEDLEGLYEDTTEASSGKIEDDTVE